MMKSLQINHLKRLLKGAALAALAAVALPAQAQIAFVRTHSGSGGLLDTSGTLAQISGPYNLAFSKDTSRLFFAEYNNQGLSQVTLANRKANKLAGVFGQNMNDLTAGAARSSYFNFPTGVAQSNDTIVYVINYAQQANNYTRGGLQRINLRTNQVAILARYTASRGLGIAPARMAGDNDTVYTGSSSNGIEEIIVRANGTIAGTRSLIPHANTPSATSVSTVTGILVKGDTLYIIENGGRLLKAPRSTTGNFEVISTNFSNPSQVVMFSDSTLLVSENGANRVSLFNLKTNVRSTYINVGAQVAGVAVNDTAIFFSEWQNYRIRYVRRNALGTPLAFLGQNNPRPDGDSSTAIFRGLTDVTLGPDSVLYVSETGYSGGGLTLGGALRRVDTASGRVTTVALPRGATRPITHLTSKDGWIYFTENARNSVFRVTRYNPATNREDYLAGAAGLTGPSGSIVEGDSATSRLKFPSGIAVNHSGTKAYFGSSGGSNEGGQTIRVIDLATKTTSSVAGVDATPGLVNGPAATAQFSDPVDLAIWGDSILFVADRGNDRIRKIDLRTNLVSDFAGTGTDQRVAVDNNVGTLARINTINTLEIDTLRKLLYFTDGNLLRVVELTGTNRVRTILGTVAGGYRDGTARQAQLNNPLGMGLLTGSNKLFIADAGNERIRRVQFFLNTAPTFTKGADVRVNENAPLTTIPDWATGITRGTQLMENTQGLTFVLTPDQPALFQTLPTVDSLGTLRFRPATNRFGTANIRIRLRDNGGVDGGGIDSTVSSFFQIIIDSVNSAPALTVPAASQTITASGNGQPVTLNGWGTGTAASGAPNFEQWQTLSISFSTTRPQLYAAAPSGTINTANGNTALTFTPALGASGRDTVTYVLRDNGGTDRGGVDSLMGTFVIVINPYVNAAPTGTLSATLATQNLVPVVSGAVATNVANIITAITPGPAAENWQTLTATVRTNRPQMYSVAPSVTITGTTSRTATLSFTQSGVPGTDTLFIVIKDNGGTFNNGVDSIVRQVRVIVGVNQAPAFSVTAANLTLSYPANATNSVTIGNWATAVSPGPAAEATAQNVSFTVRSKNPAIYATAPSITVSGTGATRTGSLNFVLNGTNGSDTATVVLRDNGGTLAGGVDSLARTLIVNVGIVGVKTQLDAGLISLYPNPSAGIIHLAAEQLPAGAAEVSVFDATGRVVFATQANFAAGVEQRFDLRALEAGSYLLRVATDKGQIIKHVQIIK